MNDETDLQRRGVLQAAGIAILGGLAASSAAAPARLQGVQHFGLTVQNMDRAFAFYTEVLGGTEVMRDGDFYGERIG